MRLLEHRRLLHGQAHVKPDQHQHCGEQEGDPPTPRHEVFLALRRREHEQQAVGQELATRRARLRPARPVAAPRRVAVLGDDQDRAAPLAAEREALHEPQDHEQDRREHPDRRVPGQQADREGRHAHQQQAEHEQLLAPDAVAEVAEHEPAERPRHEADGEGRQRLERPGRGVGGREEDRGEDDRGRHPVEEEVVPLDRGAGHARGHHADDVRLRLCPCRCARHRLSRSVR
jgi:hypothetical protein